MPDLNYAHEKYGAAVTILATKDELLRPRLIEAVAEALHFNPDAPHAGREMSNGLGDLLREFRDKVTATKGPSGAITATIESLTDDDVRDLATELLALEYRLDEEWQEKRWS